LHCFLDRRIAPGYVAWIADDSTSVHVGVGGYRHKFQPSAALDAFRSTIRSIVELREARFVERRGGRIPVGGVLPNLANRRGLLVGDAAGAVSPLTAGGLDPCLRLSQLAATVVHRYLTTGDESHLAVYDGRRFRRQFFARRVLRAVYAVAGTNLILEGCTAALRLPLGRRLAHHVFFSRGSFPDVPAFCEEAKHQPGRGATRATTSRGKPQNPQAVPVD
jgi:flavin-dependent dehydrogenase